jgi:putative ABC transport system permease protein
MILTLAIKSLRNRRLTAVLTIVSIALAVALLLGVERIRAQSRAAFASTISGTDLVVGARTSPVHLLLFSVFHIGDPNNNVRWESYRALATLPDVAWSIPLSLGDSHRGFRVVGTTRDYFAHLRFARDHPLAFAHGAAFADDHSAVLGSVVAQALGYELGQPIVLAHGTGDVQVSLHLGHPFRVVGILAPTGTPVDRTIHVALEGIDHIHGGAGATAYDPLTAAVQAARRGAAASDERQPISAFLLGLRARAAALSMQRRVDEFAAEPLTAILPGVTLLEVWEVAGSAERALAAVSILVVAVGLCGMLVALLTSLAERRREMAVLRSVGARPLQVSALVLGEAALLALVGSVLGFVVLEVVLLVAQPWLQSDFGWFLEPAWPSRSEAGLMLIIVLAAMAAGIIPAYRIYRFSLADGMTIRI